MIGAIKRTPAASQADGVVGVHAVRRISWLTLAIGLTAALTTALASHHGDWSAGLAIGSVLAWLNFRWLKGGIDALVSVAAAQAGAEKPRVRFGTWFRLFFRYGLIGLCVYVIFKYLRVPLVSMVIGLCALGAATIAASLWEILNLRE